jgi:sterol 14-demethylase
MSIWGRFKYSAKLVHFQHLTTPVFGKDVVYDVPNEVLMEQKKFVKVSLSTDKFRSYVGMIEDEIDEYVKHDPAFKIYQMNDVNEWGSFNVVDVLQQITILTASRTLQGKEVRGSLDKTFSELYMDLDGGFTALNFLFPNLPLESYRKRDRAHQKMSKFYTDCIQKRRTDNDVGVLAYHESRVNITLERTRYNRIAPDTKV